MKYGNRFKEFSSMSKGDTVALVWGRLNPPTIGHLSLIQTLSDVGADHHQLYLTHTQDKKKNPFSYEEKLMFVQEFFGRQFPQVEIVDTDQRTLVGALGELTGRFNNVKLVAGSDRVNEFQTLLDKYNGIPDKSGTIPYSFDSIEVVSAGDRDPDADDVSGMSASKLRAFAVEGNFEAFLDGVPTDNVDLAREMYDTIRSRLKVKEADEAPEPEAPEEEVEVEEEPIEDTEALKVELEEVAKAYGVPELGERAKPEWDKIPEEERMFEKAHALLLQAYEGSVDETLKKNAQAFKSAIDRASANPQFPTIAPNKDQKLNILVTVMDPISTAHMGAIASLSGGSNQLGEAGGVLIADPKNALLDLNERVGVTSLFGEGKFPVPVQWGQKGASNLVTNFGPEVAVHGDPKIVDGVFASDLSTAWRQVNPDAAAEGGLQKARHSSSSEVLDAPNPIQTVFELASKELRGTLTENMKKGSDLFVKAHEAGKKEVKDEIAGQAVMRNKETFIQIGKMEFEKTVKILEESRSEELKKILALLPGSNQALKQQLFAYLYLKIKERGTGDRTKLLADLLDSLFLAALWDLFKAERQAVANVGEELGLTQIARAGKAAVQKGQQVSRKNTAKSRAANQPQQ